MYLLIRLCPNLLRLYDVRLAHGKPRIDEYRLKGLLEGLRVCGIGYHGGGIPQKRGHLQQRHTIARHLQPAAAQGGGGRVHAPQLQQAQEGHVGRGGAREACEEQRHRAEALSGCCDGPGAPKVRRTAAR